MKPRKPKSREHSRLAKKLASSIDHTLLRPTALKEEILETCKEAIAHGFKAVCIPGAYVKTAADALSGSGALLATVVGFPLGTTSTRAKCCETEASLQDGAQELDVVLNPSWILGGRHTAIARELTQLRSIASGACLKLILETCNLQDTHITTACQLARDAGWDFVKTSTGFGTAGATLEDVALMRQAVGAQMGIKASGGIRTLEEALRFLQAGATRIGTSSGVGILMAAQSRRDPPAS